MLKVRDKTETLKDYKGRWTYAVDKMCPCRPCYNAHDCGYSAGGTGEWVISMHCATNYNKGCPQPHPKPQHIIKFSGKQAICFAKRLSAPLKPYKAFSLPKITRRCLRCGCVVYLEKDDFKTQEEV